jgi:O-antigen/teichoic acid export membrane protein
LSEIETDIDIKEGQPRYLLSLSWQSVAYGVGVFGRQVIVYLTLPLFTMKMRQEEFGVISVMVAFLSFIDMLSNAGLPAATFRLYNDTSISSRKSQILGSSLILFIIFSVVMVLAVWISAGQLAFWLLGNKKYTNILRLVSVILVFTTLNYYGYVLLRIQVRPVAFSLQNLFQAVVQVGLALWFVISFNLGSFGYWVGQLGGALIGLLLMIYLVRNTLELNVTGDALRQLTAYALPMLPASLSLWALKLVDRSLISSFSGLESVAIYEIGYKVGTLTGLVTLPFIVAWPQFAFSRIHRPDAPLLFRNVLTILAAGCTFISVGVIAFSSELIGLLAPPSYGAAVAVVPWVAISQIAWGVYPVLSLGPKIAKRTWHIGWTTGVAAVINILINIILIPPLGILGAAIATLISYILLAIIVYVVGQRFYSFPIDFVRLWKLGLAFLITSFVVIQLSNLALPPWESMTLRLLGLSLFPLILIISKFVTFDQIRALLFFSADAVKETIRPLNY